MCKAGKNGGYRGIVVVRLRCRHDGSISERQELLDVFLGRCTWVRVYFGWRPTLADEADNHLVKLAVAVHAQAIVTGNARHLMSGELRFPGLRILDPATFMSEWNRRAP